ncbi:MAG: hypothetical protein ACI9CD_001183 [Candidatus Deianiraeaceae bacterium]|jgi:hypothetical protein
MLYLLQFNCNKVYFVIMPSQNYETPVKDKKAEEDNTPGFFSRNFNPGGAYPINGKPQESIPGAGKLACLNQFWASNSGVQLFFRLLLLCAAIVAIAVGGPVGFAIGGSLFAMFAAIGIFNIAKHRKESAHKAQQTAQKAEEVQVVGAKELEEVQVDEAKAPADNGVATTTAPANNGVATTTALEEVQVDDRAKELANNGVATTTARIDSRATANQSSSQVTNLSPCCGPSTKHTTHTPQVLVNASRRATHNISTNCTNQITPHM